MGDFAAYAALQVTTASISFMASTIISAMVAKSRQEPSGNLTIYSSPYHRIILGISISDLFSSIEMLLLRHCGQLVPTQHARPMDSLLLLDLGACHCIPVLSAITVFARFAKI
jgi:hypothetical protein